MNIRIVTSILIAIFTSFNLVAQGGDVEERIQEARVKFFTSELQLNEKESEVFWPLFDQYREDQKALKKSYKTKKKLALLSDEEVETHIYKMFELEEKELALKKQYFENLKAKLPIRKVAMLEATERKFKRQLLKKVRKNRQGRMRG